MGFKSKGLPGSKRVDLELLYIICFLFLQSVVRYAGLGYKFQFANPGANFEKLEANFAIAADPGEAYLDSKERVVVVFAIFEVDNCYYFGNSSTSLLQWKSSNETGYLASALHGTDRTSFLKTEYDPRTHPWYRASNTTESEVIDKGKSVDDPSSSVLNQKKRPKLAEGDTLDNVLVSSSPKRSTVPERQRFLFSNLTRITSASSGFVIMEYTWGSRSFFLDDVFDGEDVIQELQNATEEEKEIAFLPYYNIKYFPNSSLLYFGAVDIRPGSYSYSLTRWESLDQRNETIRPQAYFDVGTPPNKSLKLILKSATILAGIITVIVITIVAWKRMKTPTFPQSNNWLEALLLEDSDLDESYQTDQVLYENLLKGATLLSAGSSGQVYKVKYLNLQCAMKVFSANARLDFRKESIILTTLSHPYIVKPFCCFRKSFIIMELLEEDLYTFISKIRGREIDYDMPWEVALDVMLQIAEGMSYLHQRGIAHLDVKSLNILLDLRGAFHQPGFRITAKIADFGSARFFHPESQQGFTLPSEMSIGTRLWNAPELLKPRGGVCTHLLGMHPRISPKPLDIYGFAIICSEIITKESPFSGDGNGRVRDLAFKIRQGHRPALPSDGCPRGLKALIMECWHTNPRLRPEFREVCTRLVEVRSSLDGDHSSREG